MKRALIVCPGRGSYGRAQLKTLQGSSPLLNTLDQLRKLWGRPTLRELDAAPHFKTSLHMAGEHASLLTFGAAAEDLRQLSKKKVKVVAVTGNSMGWYIALYAAGVLSLTEAARLIETMGVYQINNVIGAQFLYPLVDGEWQPVSEYKEAVDNVLQEEGVYVSIRLGGTVVLGVSEEKKDWLLQHLPKVQRGSRTFPMQLPTHSAFHTPLLQESASRGQQALKDLQMQPPKQPLIAGNGRVFRKWASLAELWEYTLQEQVVEPYDFTKAIQTALGDYAPDVVVLPGPGDNLGAPIAQAMIGMGWQGLRSASDFKARQNSDSPLLISMARPEQRSLVVD